MCDLLRGPPGCSRLEMRTWCPPRWPGGACARGPRAGRTGGQVSPGQHPAAGGGAGSTGCLPVSSLRSGAVLRTLLAPRTRPSILGRDGAGEPRAAPRPGLPVAGRACSASSGRAGGGMCPKVGTGAVSRHPRPVPWVPGPAPGRGIGLGPSCLLSSVTAAAFTSWPLPSGPGSLHLGILRPRTGVSLVTAMQGSKYRDPSNLKSSSTHCALS